MYIIGFINKVASKYKGEPFKIDNFDTQDILVILFKRLKMLVRGKITSLFYFGNVQLFLGRNVTLEGKRKISFKDGATIHNYCKISALGAEKISIGKNFSMRDNTIIESLGSLTEKSQSLEIGDNCGFSENCHIAIRGNIKIGNDVIFGPGTKIFSENHSFQKNELIRKQLSVRKGVTIGNNCWIGANVIILDDVSLKNNVIVAAGSVVTKSFDSNCIIAGVPAKFIKKL